MPPLPGHRGAPGARARSGTRRCSSTRWSGKLPAGLSRDGEPLYLNLDFLDGTTGAHVNISGISGVATKTSYATFLLYCLFHSGVLGARGGQHQGADLQREGRGPALPRPRQHPARPTSERGRYARLGLPAGAVPQRRPSAPRPARDDPTAAPDVAARHDGVTSLLLDASQEFCQDELLPFLFADAEDERQQYTMVVHNVDRPAGRRRPGRGGDGGGAHRRRHRAHVPRAGRAHLEPGPRRGRRPTAGPAGHRRRARSTPSSAGSTAPSATCEHLIRADVARRASPPRRHRRGPGHRRRPPQPARPGQALRRRRRRCARRSTSKERPGTARPLQFVVLDELNKYAPREGVQPDQGDPARRGRAGPLARHHPHRRPADGQRGRAAHHRQLAPSGSSAASTRPRPGGASTASCPPCSGSGPRSSSRARCS